MRINHVSTGTIVSEPEISGEAARFSVISRRTYTNAQGELIASSYKWDLHYRGSQLEALTPHLVKGQRIGWEGFFIGNEYERPANTWWDSEVPEISINGPEVWVGENNEPYTRFQAVATRLSVLGPSPVKKLDKIEDVTTVVIAGYLARDPEMRYTADGVPVTNSSMGHSRTRNNGEDKEKITTWFRLSIWRNSAEVANQYWKKGGFYVISGVPVADTDTGAPRIWFDRETNDPRAGYEINVTSWSFGPRPNGGPGAASESSYQMPLDQEDDEIPF